MNCAAGFVRAEENDVACNERQFAFFQSAKTQRRTRLDAEIGNERIESQDGARTSIDLELQTACDWNGHYGMPCEGDRERCDAQFMDNLILEKGPVAYAEVAGTRLRR